MTLKVGVVGATGYTGVELLRILFRHPEVDVVLATSEKFAGKKLKEAWPFLQGEKDLVLQGLDDVQIASSCDLVFSCLPHQSAMEHISAWMEKTKKGMKVVDLSADFRLHSAATYGEWYGRHTASELLKKAVYGLPELHRDEIKKASLVGNPGCYPTGAILGCAPLLKAGLIDPDHIIIDSKSGVTGAGRGSTLESLFSEVNESVHAYKVGGKHRHTPEIEQELSGISGKGKEIVVSFTPHLIPMDRGILSTLHLQSKKKNYTKSILKTFLEFYKDEPFIQILPDGILPKTKEVRGTNYCRIGAVGDTRTDQIIVITAIDNLMKGASSQAVQNMNLMCGFGETLGLETLPLVP